MLEARQLFTLGKRARTLRCSLLLGLLIFSGCKTYLRPERPTDLSATREFPRELSKMALPIDISIPHLQKQLNAALPTDLYRDMSYTDNGGDDLKVRITRVGNIQLRGEGAGLHYELPLRVWADMRYQALGFSVSEETSMEVVLRFHSDMSLNPDWSVRTRTQAMGYQFLKKPVLDLGLVKVDLDPYLRGAIGQVLREMGPMLDKQVGDYLNLKAEAEKAWRDLQRPIQLDKDYNTWLYLQPQKIHLAPVKATKDHLRIETGLETYADIRVGNPEGHQPKITPLPELIRAPMSGEQFALNLAVGISFDEATRILKKEFVGYTYQEGKRVVTITDLEMYGNGDKVVLVVGLAGSVNGEAYMVGTPYYDPTTRTMKLSNFDFDVKTSKLALQVADFLVHGPFRKRLEAYTDLPLGAYIDQYQAMITESLADDFGFPGLRFDVQVDQVEPKDIFVQPSELRLQLRLTGKARVRYGL